MIICRCCVSSLFFCPQSGQKSIHAPYIYINCIVLVNILYYLLFRSFKLIFITAESVGDNMALCVWRPGKVESPLKCCSSAGWRGYMVTSWCPIAHLLDGTEKTNYRFEITTSVISSSRLIQQTLHKQHNSIFHVLKEDRKWIFLSKMWHQEHCSQM